VYWRLTLLIRPTYYLSKKKIKMRAIDQLSHIVDQRNFYF
jgi:hypothetical protein